MSRLGDATAWPWPNRLSRLTKNRRTPRPFVLDMAGNGRVGSAMIGDVEVVSRILTIPPSYAQGKQRSPSQATVQGRLGPLGGARAGDLNYVCIPQGPECRMIMRAPATLDSSDMANSCSIHKTPFVRIPLIQRYPSTRGVGIPLDLSLIHI